MKTLRMLMLLAACGAAITSNMVGAAEPAPAKPAQPAAKAAAVKPADESAAPKSGEDSKDRDGEEAAAKPKAAATAADKKGSSPQRFVPSEQVRADFDVSFPIDI